VLVRVPVLLIITYRIFILGFGQLAEQPAKETHKGISLLLGIIGIHRTGFVKN
jgi:hypothetical protein